MRTWVLALVAAAMAAPADAQRQRFTIDTETAEGQMLQQIGQEENEEQKLALLERFVAQYPTHEAAGWAHAMMVPSYLKAGRNDEALTAGEKALELDPEDLQTAHNVLKTAEATKDPDLLRKWALHVSGLARKVAESPKPADEDEAEEWEHRVDFAKQLDTYTEYSLYAAALQTADPHKQIELVETLQQHNPESEYLPRLRSHYFFAMQKAGNLDRAVEIAEEVLAQDKTNEDMLLVAADYYLHKKKDPKKVLEYSAQLVELMESKEKPEGASDADWAARKHQVMGIALWMQGTTYSTLNRFQDADNTLRKALPLIKGNDQLLAGALFHLGLANFKLEKILDAIKFNEQCIAIKSPYQAHAKRNLQLIHSQYRVVR